MYQTPCMSPVFRCEWDRREPGAGYPYGHQEGRHLHPLQRGGGDPETRGEATQRYCLETGLDCLNAQSSVLCRDLVTMLCVGSIA